MSLKTIFEAYIAFGALVYTDKWTGFVSLQKDYNIIPQHRNKRQSMKQMHTIIHLLKSWLRSVY